MRRHSGLVAFSFSVLFFVAVWMLRAAAMRQKAGLPLWNW